MSESIAVPADPSAAIVEYVEATDHVSFAELHNRFAWFGSPKEEPGGYMIENGKHLIWAGMSKIGADAIMDALDNQKVAIAASSLLVYLIDGRVPAEKRWRPLVLRPARFGKAAPNKWLVVRGKRKARR